jgi:hypothetical protein
MGFAAEKDAFPAEVVVGLSMSTPRIKAEQGAGYVGEKSLGAKFRMTIESWNTRLLVSAGLGPNDPGYKESVEFLRTSYDGETIQGDDAETTVKDYVNFLKEAHGYDKARSTPYADIWGFLTWTEKDGAIAPEDQTLHLLQASQTSMGAWQAFCTTQGLLRAKGIGKEFTEVEVTAMPRAKGTLKYTNFAFSVPKA